jgi:hypothetical protein
LPAWKPVGRWYEPRLVLALPKPENEMADALVNLFEWCKRERERLQMQREMLQSGRFRIHENDESGQRDISDQNIARLTDNIAELDGLIAGYEAKRG